MISENHETVIARFVAACHADERVLAAFIGGSYATGKADECSDLDLYLITTSVAYDNFLAERESFLRRLGEPVFSEDFNGFGFDMVIFIFVDGVEGELAFANEQHFDHIHGGPFKVLVDKTGILSGTDFPLQKPTESEQREMLRRLVYWFWRDLSLFLTAMTRKQLWTAYGYLENLRLTCVNLARLKYDFTVGADGYEKLEQAADDRVISSLQTAFCPLTRQAMLEAARTLVQFYLETAPDLARMYGTPYPAKLERVLSKRFDDMARTV